MFRHHFFEIYVIHLMSSDYYLFRRFSYQIAQTITIICCSFINGICNLLWVTVIK